MMSMFHSFFYYCGVLFVGCVCVIFIYGVACSMFSLNLGDDEAVVFSSDDKQRIDAIIDNACYKNYKNKTSTRSSGKQRRSKFPVDDYSVVDGNTINNDPSTKEYLLPDGSKIQVNPEETKVTEETILSGSPSERFGGGMAEIIRKRRESEVF